MPTTAIEDQPSAVAVERLPARPSIWVPLAFAAVYILWGSTYIGIRIAIESFPPLAMAAVRHSLVGLILYPILRWKTGYPADCGALADGGRDRGIAAVR